ncbi:hypothetical protein GPECTOR_39g380 [Gonium pectorale]|uniref:F-box domain-containing protein n=1 Tax=Gonium pectorale TaxID=33097 RepID=A0A150GAL2_GONPE|nr:hypothetical protein GPECTOR_39g380 [Gonium pectorale]|eukprot:KXZ46886.1 hypothetical protein GPECTOR_39g380 [Gonium pectorale]
MAVTGYWNEFIWPRLPPELADRIVNHMEPNEVATSFRCVSKATAARFSSPEHTTVRLSRPVPPHAFAARWLAPGATRELTLEQRRQLQRLVAASGVVANLEVVERATGCLLMNGVFKAAAAAGRLASCQWLWEQGYDIERCDLRALGVAAGRGHRHVCEWLLSLDIAWFSSGEAEAARSGLVGLMEWLREQRPTLHWHVLRSAEPPHAGVAEGVACGCGLATLQRLLPGLEPLCSHYMERVLSAAARSSTRDWTAKVEWLVAQGCPRSSAATEAVAGRPDAAERLAWLRDRGFPVGWGAVEAAAERGNLEVLRRLLAEVTVPSHGRNMVASGAAGGGRLAVLQLLHGAGWLLDAPCTAQAAAKAAAKAGQLHVLAWLVETRSVQLLAWLVETLGAEAVQLDSSMFRCAVQAGSVQLLAWLVETRGAEAVQLDSSVFTCAAQAGSVQMMAWLRERGCAWSESAYSAAAEGGCEAALEWLAERGCPMPADGDPYCKACVNGDLAVARCLRRLGVPWGPDGRVYRYASEWDAPEPMLRWLLEAGCPVDSDVHDELSSEE